MTGKDVVMTSELVHVISLTEAKRRFSELIERVGRGERIIIARRGTPVMVLVSPNEVGGPCGARINLRGDQKPPRLRIIEPPPQTTMEASGSAKTDKSLQRPTLGLAAIAGALSDWDDIDAAVAEIYAMRDRAAERPVPSLE